MLSGMLPLRDDNPSSSTPYVTYFLIAANVMVFVYELMLGGRGLQGFLLDYGVVPQLMSQDLVAVEHGDMHHLAGLVPLFTNIFMHGGWLHLGGNMLFLYIFGDNVEDRMGHVPYLAFYLLAGIAASLTHVWSNPASSLPSLGASGAIGGVLGAYIVLFPKARIMTLATLGFFMTTLEIPAIFFLGIWFVMQSIQGLASLGAHTAQTGGTAYWAHIGGFAVGFLGGFIAKQVTGGGRSPHADRWYSNR
ncbi:MAG: putative rane protein [Cyanobacteria bacterium RYN_339]|nr:putative rane protein [Cyanobacteria bacterium RYN_339]